MTDLYLYYTLARLGAATVLVLSAVVVLLLVLLQRERRARIAAEVAQKAAQAHLRTAQDIITAAALAEISDDDLDVLNRAHRDELGGLLR